MPFTFWARNDSNSANNPALNLTGAPPTQLTFIAQTPAGGSGDMILDGGGVSDPNTSVEIGGVSYSFTFELTGTMPVSKSDGANQVPDPFEGSVVMVVTVQDYPAPGEQSRFAFMPEEFATAAEMGSFGNGAISIQTLNTSPPSTPICFVAGTMIATPTGEFAVERLRAGDLVMTMDGHARPIRWIGGRTHGIADLMRHPHWWPVRVPAHGLGNGLPHADLWLSANHHLALTGWHTELLFAQPGVLAAAKYLFAPVMPAQPVTYFHILLDSHDVLIANGLPCESLFLGQMAEAILSDAARLDIDMAMPWLARRWERYGKTALPVLKAFEAALYARVAGLARLDRPDSAQELRRAA